MFTTPSNAIGIERHPRDGNGKSHINQSRQKNVISENYRGLWMEHFFNPPKKMALYFGNFFGCICFLNSRVNDTAINLAQIFEAAVGEGCGCSETGSALPGSSTAPRAGAPAPGLRKQRWGGICHVAPEFQGGG